MYDVCMYVYMQYLMMPTILHGLSEARVKTYHFLVYVQQLETRYLKLAIQEGKRFLKKKKSSVTKWSL